MLKPSNVITKEVETEVSMESKVVEVQITSET